MFLTSIALSLLVVFCGFYLLAKTQKSKLGSLFSMASYGLIIGGILLFGFSVCFAAMHISNHGHQQYKKCSKNDSSCKKGKKKKQIKVIKLSDDEMSEEEMEKEIDKYIDEAGVKGDKKIVKKVISTDGEEKVEVEVTVE